MSQAELSGLVAFYQLLLIIRTYHVLLLGYLPRLAAGYSPLTTTTNTAGGLATLEIPKNWLCTMLRQRRQLAQAWGKIAVPKLNMEPWVTTARKGMDFDQPGSTGHSPRPTTEMLDVAGK